MDIAMSLSGDLSTFVGALAAGCYSMSLRRKRMLKHTLV